VSCRVQVNDPSFLDMFFCWVKSNGAYCALGSPLWHVAVACVEGAGDFWNHFPIYCVGKARSSGVSVSLTYGGVVVAVIGHYSDDLPPSSGEDRVLAC
jgi:hypothetical protein